MQRSAAIPATAALRVAVALALAAGSFLALRYTFHGECIIPTYYALPSYHFLRFLFFATLPVAFVIGFVWLVSELAYPLVSVSGLRTVSARRQSLLAGVAAYLAIGVAGWLLAPALPRYLDISREWVWIFWPIAMLVMSGNFSNFGCGY